MNAFDKLCEQVKEMSPEQRQRWTYLMRQVFDNGRKPSDAEVRELWEMAPVLNVSDEDYQFILDYLADDGDDEGE